MNLKNLQQIFENYLGKFEYINNDQHNENYKWEIAKNFRTLMDEALSKDGKAFAEGLYKAKEATFNIIDSFTQPFYGLVEFARKDPDTVKKMFLDLYSDDGGDLLKQEKLIEDFINTSKELLDKYNPESYRYKQNSHSVSSYLFLYDPDHHYMYKATHVSIFADCIGYHRDWGTGNNIKLESFYSMCDKLIDEIKKSDILISTDASRFDGRFKVKPEDLFEDKEKHMLAFDIIYCCSSYDLYDGIKFNKPKAKEKKLYNERKKKALELEEEYNNLNEEYELLKEAKIYYINILKTGTEVKHKVFGNGTVESIDDRYITVFFHEKNEKKKLGLDVAIANEIIKSDISGFEKKSIVFKPVLKKGNLIESSLKRTRKVLKEYEEYLE